MCSSRRGQIIECFLMIQNEFIRLNEYDSRGPLSSLQQIYAWEFLALILTIRIMKMYTLKSYCQRMYKLRIRVEQVLGV